MRCHVCERKGREDVKVKVMRNEVAKNVNCDFSGDDPEGCEDGEGGKWLWQRWDRKEAGPFREMIGKLITWETNMSFDVAKIDRSLVEEQLIVDCISEFFEW